MTWLGALRQLDFDHLDVVQVGALRKGLFGKTTLAVIAAEIAGTDIPDERAMMLKVVTADAALAGVMRKIPHCSTLVQCLDGIGRQRAEAHGRNVEHRQRTGARAVGPAHIDTKIAVLGMCRLHGMVDPFEVGLVDIALSAEGALVDLLLCALINERAVYAGKWRFVGIVLKEVLAHFRSNHLEEIAQIAD